MDRIDDMRLLVLAAQCGSLAGAARQMGLSPASVTRRVQALEAALGARLIDRTTRRLALTEAGEIYRAGAVEVLARIDEMERGAVDLHDRPRGVLRVLARRSFAFMQLAPRLARFTGRYPDLSVELTLTEAPESGFAGSFDLLIRLNAPREKSLTAIRLASSQRVLCAAPAYLDRAPPLEAPAQLARHACLLYRYAQEQPRWRFHRGDQELELDMHGTLVSNSGEVLRQAALAGAGIALLPAWMVSADLAGGELRPCLPGYTAYPVGFDARIFAVHRRGGFVPAKVRVFVEFLLREFAGEPWFGD